MNNKTLIAVFLAVASVTCQGQIVRPWWTMNHNFSVGSTMTNRAASAATLANGAFVVGGTGAVTNEGLNGVTHSIYRNGSAYFKLSNQTTGTRNEEVKQMVNDRFGNLFTATDSTTGISFHEIQVAKINSNGTQAWTSSIMTNPGSITDMTTDRDGNVYVLHRNDINRITKIDGKTGLIQWNWAGFIATSTRLDHIACDQEGRLFVLGTVLENSRGVLVFDIDQSNGLEGNNKFYGLANPISEDLVVDNLGRVVVAFSDGETTFNSTVVCIDWAQQNESWSYIPPSNLMHIKKLAVDNQNFIVAAGVKYGDVDGILPNDLYVARVNPSGGIVFEKAAGTLAGSESLQTLLLDRFGEAYLYALRSSGGIGSQYLTKFSTTGVQRWSQLYSDPAGNMTPLAMTIFDRSGDMLAVSKIPNGLLNYQAIQQAPVAILDGFNVAKGKTYNSTRPVVDNDRFPLGIAVKKEADVSNGTLHLSHTGHFVYTPNAGYTGTDWFTYKLERPGLSPSVATVMLHVQ